MLKSSQGEVVVFSLFWTSTVRADSSAARIEGMGSDQTSAMASPAKAFFTNTKTKESTELNTTSDRTFHLLSLPVGTYEVTVSKAGFRTRASLRPGLSAQIAQVEAAQTGINRFGTKYTDAANGAKMGRI